MKTNPRVGLVGTYQVGKSCLINLLLGRICTPVGDGLFSKTKANILFRYGLDERVIFERNDGSYAISSIEEFVATNSNFPSCKGITIYVNAEILESMDLVDIPGINANDSEDAIAYQAIDKLDYVIVMNRNTTPLDNVVINLIRYVNSNNIPYLYVVNCFHNSVEYLLWDPKSHYNKDRLAVTRAKLITSTHDYSTTAKRENHEICINLAWAAYAILSEEDLETLFPISHQNNSLLSRLQQFCNTVKPVKLDFNKIDRAKWFEVSNMPKLLEGLRFLINQPPFSNWELGTDELYNRGMSLLKKNDYQKSAEYLEAYNNRILSSIKNFSSSKVIATSNLESSQLVEILGETAIYRLAEASFVLGVLYIVGAITGIPEIGMAKQLQKLILNKDLRKCLVELTDGHYGGFNPSRVEYYHHHNYCDGKTCFEPTIVHQNWRNFYIDFELEGVTLDEIIFAHVGLTTQFTKGSGWEYVHTRSQARCILNHVSANTYRLYIDSIPDFFEFSEGDYWTEVSEIKVKLENDHATKRWPFDGGFYIIRVKRPQGKELLLRLKDCLPNNIFKLK